MTLGSTGDFEPREWDVVTFTRYRSRSDFLEFILESDWNADVKHKWAALERNQHLPATPKIRIVGVGLVPFLVLVRIGLWLDRIIGRVPAYHSENT
jgi:hypothetical protein